MEGADYEPNLRLVASSLMRTSSFWWSLSCRLQAGGTAGCEECQNLRSKA